MDTRSSYKWEAQTSSGDTIVTGGDLRGCTSISLVPQVPGLPRHDIVGLPLHKRFCRGFIKSYFAEKITLPGLFFWENGSKFVRTDTDQRDKLKPGDMVGKGVAGDGWYRVAEVSPEGVRLSAAYAGKTKARGFLGRQYIAAAEPRRRMVHCIETTTCRMWVDTATGSMLVTPRGFELYL